MGQEGEQLGLDPSGGGHWIADCFSRAKLVQTCLAECSLMRRCGKGMPVSLGVETREASTLWYLERCPSDGPSTGLSIR